MYGVYIRAGANTHAFQVVQDSKVGFEAPDDGELARPPPDRMTNKKLIYRRLTIVL
jgi:hypothetical protein